MSRSGAQSEARTPVFKSPSKLGTHLLTSCDRNERLSRLCPARRTHSIAVPYWESVSMLNTMKTCVV
ncbi:hypothetical protein TNCV_4261661 [Trichonephila clavipes]|nr:hypothetical protein TNCV_4261661 [Trichonephila clavipes]